MKWVFPTFDILEFDAATPSQTIIFIFELINKYIVHFPSFCNKIYLIEQVEIEPIIRIHRNAKTK